MLGDASRSFLSDIPRFVVSAVSVVLFSSSVLQTRSPTRPSSVQNTRVIKSAKFLKLIASVRFLMAAHRALSSVVTCSDLVRLTRVMGFKGLSKSRVAGNVPDNSFLTSLSPSDDLLAMLPPQFVANH